MLQVGKGKFWITGIISKDKDGIELVHKGEGKLKYRIKVMVKDDHGKVEAIYDPVFNVSEKIKQIINSCEDQELREDFKSGKIQLEDLLGVAGNCVIGISKEKEGYDQKSTIECYLRFTKPIQDEVQRFSKQFDAIQEDGDNLPF